MIPVLHLIQEKGNLSLTIEQMDEVATHLQISPIEVYEVATFYSMFNLKPVGKYILEVCQTGPCMVNGSDRIIDYIKNKLNIQNGETSSDGLFTLKTVECLGACGYAPMMQLGNTYKEFLTPEKIDAILDDCRKAI
ncbi:NADH dehydrogenase [ubiquinone] flavoprotein 2, mitochondrial [Filimonas sp.]|nr:NADH dehydrogenase [ubiquinone] flavoprotein 2, mitochondrial [Filimonas sp.]